MVKVASVRSRRSSTQDQRAGLCQKDPRQRYFGPQHLREEQARSLTCLGTWNRVDSPDTWVSVGHIGRKALTEQQLGLTGGSQ